MVMLKSLLNKKVKVEFINSDKYIIGILLGIDEVSLKVMPNIVGGTNIQPILVPVSQVTVREFVN